MELPPYEEYEQFSDLYCEKTYYFGNIDQYKYRKIGRFLREFVHKTRSMMSGHSPVSHEMFEFKDAHATPPSTSKESEAAGKMLTGSVLVDAAGGVTSSDNHSSFSSRNNFKFIDSTLPCVDDQVPLAENEDLPNTSGSTDETKDDSKLSEDSDKPDGAWPEKDEKEIPNEEDFCFKCLYVSMKCCECIIM